VLERRAPPTFDVLIEIRDRHHLLVHHNVSEAVDALLRNRLLVAELRYWDDQGNMRSERVRISREDERAAAGLSPRQPRQDPQREAESLPTLHAASSGETVIVRQDGQDAPSSSGRLLGEARSMRLYAFGVSKHRLKQAARQLGVSADFVDSLDDADVLITTKSYYRQRPRAIVEAEQDNVPIYVLRSNSVAQMESCLADLFGLADLEATSYERAIRETEEAIRRVLAGERVVELSPQNAFIRRQQHQLARESNLLSHSYGKEPMRRVRIFRE